MLPGQSSSLRFESVKGATDSDGEGEVRTGFANIDVPDMGDDVVLDVNEGKPMKTQKPFKMPQNCSIKRGKTWSAKNKGWGAKRGATERMEKSTTMKICPTKNTAKSGWGSKTGIKRSKTAAIRLDKSDGPKAGFKRSK